MVPTSLRRARLARVRFLMVDAKLHWKVRTKRDRGSRLCGLSWIVFSGLKDYISVYTEGTDPLPSWASILWFPKIGPYRWRTNDINPEKFVTHLQHHWPFILEHIWSMKGSDRELFRFGGLREYQKFDPAVKRWRIPRVHSLALDLDVIENFNDSHESCWAEILMDRAIDCIFD